VLKELNADKHPIITCLNKIDKCDNKAVCLYLKITYPKTVEISALNKTGFEQLFELMMEEISKLRKIVKLRIPQSHYALVSKIIKQGRIIFCDYEGNDVILEAEIPHDLEHEVLKYLI
jgi:GTP-binding protein HflX